EGVVNTHLVKHWEPPRGNKQMPDYLSPTVVYREFLYFDGGVDLYFKPEKRRIMEPLVSGVYSFGKQGSFFVFESSEDEAVLPHPSSSFAGSDFKNNATWGKVSKFEGSKRKPREDVEMGIALTILGASGDHVHYKF